MARTARTQRFSLPLILLVAAGCGDSSTARSDPGHHSLLGKSRNLPFIMMDEVRDKGVEFVITKDNQPVARLVPVLNDAQSKFIGRRASVIAVSGDIVEGTAPDWEA